MHDVLNTVREALHAFSVGDMQQLGIWSYVLIALLVATEGPVTTLIGAAAAAAGLLDIRLVFLSTVIGNITGDIVWYSMGYAGNINRLHRISRHAGIHLEHLEALRQEMRSHAMKAILIAKVTFGLIIPTLVAAGLARVSWRKWFPAVFVAETLWSLLLVVIGYHAAGAIAQVAAGFRVAGIGVGLLVGALVLTLALRKIKRLPAKESAAAVPVHPSLAAVAARGTQRSAGIVLPSAQSRPILAVQSSKR